MSDFLDNIYIEHIDDNPDFEPVSAPGAPLAYTSESGNTYEPYYTGDDSSAEEPAVGVEDVVLHTLQQQGVDPYNIPIINENGLTEIATFDTLTAEELSDMLAAPAASLAPEEAQMINYFRQTGLTPTQFTEQLKQQAIKEYLTTEAPVQTISEMSDDEAFLVDLLTRYDMTDDEALEALQIEKQNPYLYEKKLEVIRKDLLEKEIVEQQQAERAQLLRQQQQFESYKQQLIDNAGSIAAIAGRIELDNSEINDVLDFVTELDPNGQGYFNRALQDPEAVLKMAWFYTKGEQAIQSMSNYYETLIKEHADTAYRRGYQDALQGASPQRAVLSTKPGNKSVARKQFAPMGNPALKR